LWPVDNVDGAGGLPGSRDRTQRASFTAADSTPCPYRPRRPGARCRDSDTAAPPPMTREAEELRRRRSLPVTHWYASRQRRLRSIAALCTTKPAVIPGSWMPAGFSLRGVWSRTGGAPFLGWWPYACRRSVAAAFCLASAPHWRHQEAESAWVPSHLNVLVISSCNPCVSASTCRTPSSCASAHGGAPTSATQ
jgi:hypothetical protein